MTSFFEGIVTGLTMLAGLGALNFWMYSVFEKRLESKIDGAEIKIDNAVLEIGRIAEELRQERISKDNLYKFVLDFYKDSKK